MPGKIRAERQVALLRGINVGRAKRVAMAELRALVEELGCGDVRTLLNSGNVVFTSSRAAAGTASRIEKALTSKLGVSARVTVLSAQELSTVIRENPLLHVANDPSRLLVAVLQDPTDLSKLAALVEQDWGKDTLAVGTRAAYLWCATGILESKLAGGVNRVLGDAVTARNWATILKLHALTEE